MGNKRFVVVLFGFGSLIAGCPQVIVPNDLVVNDDAVVVNDLEVGGQINADRANLGGVEIDEDGNVLVPGDLTVGGTIGGADVTVIGDGNFGGTVTAEDIIDLPEPPPPSVPIPPPPPPPPPIPALLTATLRSDNGRDHFRVGEDIKLTVFASGGKAPYEFRCLWVDGSFSVKNDSSEPKFPLKVINSPGVGVVTCRVTSDDGQQTDAALTIYVE